MLNYSRIHVILKGLERVYTEREREREKENYESLENSVAVATGWTAGVRFSEQCTDRLWSPPSLLSYPPGSKEAEEWSSSLKSVRPIPSPPYVYTAGYSIH
jgi:hypothetical protein